jgi:hypothetical protein
MEYTQEERTKGMNCPTCGFWHEAQSCPPQNKARCRCRELEQEVDWSLTMLMKAAETDMDLLDIIEGLQEKNNQLEKEAERLRNLFLQFSQSLYPGKEGLELMQVPIEDAIKEVERLMEHIEQCDKAHTKASLKNHHLQKDLIAEKAEVERLRKIIYTYVGLKQLIESGAEIYPIEQSEVFEKMVKIASDYKGKSEQKE